jgi:hypothetical protein
VALAVAEFAFRSLGMASPIVYRSDQLFGYEPLPNQESNRLGVKIFINDASLRDDESLATLLRADQRVLVIGDSVTYGGSRTRQEDLFTEVAERELRRRHPGIKLMNAGVNGYSVSQMVHRAAHLVRETKPHYLVMYLIRSDFDRPPVQFIAEGNFVYPTSRPTSALLDVIRLSVNHLDVRYRFMKGLPTTFRAPFRAPGNLVPPFDATNLWDTHLAAVENLLQNEWLPSGRQRKDILVFFAPMRADVRENHLQPNADLVNRFRSLGITGIDLQAEFFKAITARGEDVADYYWDIAHYIEPGHALAGHLLASHFERDVLSSNSHSTSGLVTPAREPGARP